MFRALAVAVLLAGVGPGSPVRAEPFPRPPALQPRVEFWTRIYTEVGTDAGLIHDSENLGVVYERLSVSPKLGRRARQRRIDAAKERYEKILRQLARGKRSGLDAEQRRVLALWPEGVSNDTLRRAAGRVRFQLGQADKFRDGLVRSGAWKGHIERVFAAEGLPLELTALPHVESSFNPRAYSKVGAAGMWQFTRSTGRLFLRIDSAVDERLDPFRASEAAAALLRHNHEQTGTWPLAVTAYNHGTAGMRRASRKLGTRDIETIIERYRSRTFGFASKNFYTEFLAALDVDRASERYFGVLDWAEPADHEAVVLDGYYPVRALSRAFGVDVERLQLFNPALRPAVWRGEKHVPRGFALRLPRVKGRAPATTLLASIPADQRFARQRPDQTYRVRRGDTLSRIARRFGLGERQLAAYNGLRNRHRIRAGQVLRIPDRPGASSRRAASRRSAATSRAAAPAPRAEAGTLYRVRAGDNLTHIASRLGVPRAELAAANGISRPDRIHVGQILRVPPPPGAKPPATEDAGANAQPTPAAPAPARRGDTVEPDAPAPVRASAPAPAAPVTQARVAPPAATPTAHAGIARFDPSRYAAGRDGRTVVQPEETLGHFAEWLELPASRLRRLNGMGPRTPLAIGRRLRLDFARVPAAEFESRRLAYHRSLREDFFRNHRIAGTEEHVLRRGETLWELSRSRYRLPIWLLADCNPELQLGDLRPGTRLRIPRLEPPLT